MNDCQTVDEKGKKMIYIQENYASSWNREERKSLNKAYLKIIKHFRWCCLNVVVAVR